MMRNRTCFTGLALLVAFATVPAMAQDAERYRLERTQDGYVRLDTTTGAMTLCQEKQGRLSCAAASQNEPAANELDELRKQVQALQSRVAALESGAPLASGLPAEEEFERGIGYMERFFRMFLGLVREFQDDGTSPANPTPNRT